MWATQLMEKRINTSQSLRLKTTEKAFMSTAIDNYFDSSYKNLVSYFAEEEKISASELREILALIEEKK